LRRAGPNNLVLVPGSQLPYKAKWQELANALPHGSTQVLLPLRECPQRRALQTMPSSRSRPGRAQACVRRAQGVATPLRNFAWVSIAPNPARRHRPCIPPQTSPHDPGSPAMATLVRVTMYCLPISEHTGAGPSRRTVNCFTAANPAADYTGVQHAKPYSQQQPSLPAGQPRPGRSPVRVWDSAIPGAASTEDPSHWRSVG